MTHVAPTLEPTQDDLVMENVLAVEAAAEAYGAEHYGRYPTIRDEPIRALALVNPFTGAAEGVSNDYVSCPGAVAYFALCITYGGEPVGYRIIGFDADGRRAITRSNLPNGAFYAHDAVVQNAYLVRDAAEAFYQVAGRYPALTTTATTPGGKTMIDYLPDGIHLLNPYWGLRADPTDGVAATDGQVGYVAVDPNGDGIMDGYSITGAGWTNKILTLVSDVLSDEVPGCTE